MIAEIIWYHAITVDIFFITLLATLSIPILYIQRPSLLIRFIRIASVINYSLLVMIAFDGVVAMIMSKRDMSINIFLMTVVFFLLLVSEFLKGYKLKHFVLNQDRDERAFQIHYIAIVAAQLLLTFPFILLYS
jgi:hypothetical protein